METVIQTTGLTKYYGGKKVVDRLDLAIPRGAIYALLGDNGAGKSTTIRMLTGQIPPDAGRATVLGNDCWQAAYPLRHHIGYVPEKPKFYDWMTVDEIGGFTAGFHKAGFKDRYREQINRFGLERGAKLKTLSKGGYAKIALALALAIDPEVLILDEPTSGLDLFTRREFLGSMVELAAEGKTILISSHGIAEIERVVSHVAFLAQGQTLIAGTMEELRERMIRVKVRNDGTLHDPSGLGVVLDHEMSGREWQATILDPDHTAVDDLRHRPGVIELETAPLKLEDMYTALLARFHRHGQRNGVIALDQVIPAMQERGDRR